MRWDAATGVATLRNVGGVMRTWDDPLAALEWMATHNPSGGRWVGFMGYDLGRWFERLPARAVDDLRLPLAHFVYVPETARVLHTPPRHMMDADSIPLRPARSNFSRAQYMAAVSRCIGYIAAGDLFQVNLSQRFSSTLLSTPLEVYKRLEERSPGDFAALLDFGDYALVCNSPELFLRVSRDPASGRRTIVTRPIKGTRPLGPGMEGQLRDSAKDQAELHMIVDLERNDFGRVCEVGSVQVLEARRIEAHSTVYHGVAAVGGILRKDVTFVDLLRAVFPGGSITGAPKIRAMEVIDELEPVRRGPYCGAIGYVAADGSMEFNVAIRTIIAAHGQAYVPVGGGVVADSDPAAEYAETLVKAEALFAALGIVQSPDRG